MNKRSIQQRIRELKLEIYKATLEKKRIEKQIINHGDEYVSSYRERLTRDAVYLERYILWCQNKIDECKEKLRELDRKD